MRRKVRGCKCKTLNFRSILFLIWGHLSTSLIWTLSSSPLRCLANIYFGIWKRQCWSWLIFRQGSGLFSKTGLRSCNFLERIQSRMLTGNVCRSECIHMASTNKQYNTTSTLWLHREMEKEQGGEWDNPKQAERKQSNRWSWRFN